VTNVASGIVLNLIGMIMIKVYFETENWYCTPVAYFDDEETYNACLPALEKLAEESRMFVTESVIEFELDDIDNLVKEKFND
jgi:hypothetical protein